MGTGKARDRSCARRSYLALIVTGRKPLQLVIDSDLGIGEGVFRSTKASPLKIAFCMGQRPTIRSASCSIASLKQDFHMPPYVAHPPAFR